MYVVHVDLWIKPGRMVEFLPRMIANAHNSVQLEPGCVQFDVCTLDANPDVIVLYEVYKSAADFQIHLTTEHFKTFDAGTADMIAEKSVRTGQRLDLD